MTCDLCPEAGVSGRAPQGAPLRRAAKTLRQLLYCVPARIVRSGRRLILRLPAGFRHAATFRATYEAAYALRPSLSSIAASAAKSNRAPDHPGLPAIAPETAHEPDPGG